MTSPNFGRELIALGSSCLILGLGGVTSGRGGPPRGDTIQGWQLDESLICFEAEFTKNSGQTMNWKVERVGVVTMTK